MLATPIQEKSSSQTNIFTNDELNDIIAILQTSPHKRSKQDLEKLQNQLSKLDFFADFWTHLEPETSHTLLKQLRHEYAPRAKTVFNHGDPPNKFYLVLSGSVFAIAPKPSRKKTMTTIVKPAENDEEMSSSKLRRFSVIRLDSDSQKHLHNLREESDLVTDKELSELHPGNFVLCVKKQGEQFGEVALNFGTTRTATVVSREPTHFITLQPSFYNQILSKYVAKKQKDCVEFFQATPVTRTWPFESIIALTYQANKVQYQKNQCIYNAGDSCDNIYFIKEGEVEIVKEATFDDEAVNKKVQNRLHLNLDKAKLSHVNAIWKQQYSKCKVQQVTLALLGKYQVFGTEEIADGMQARLAKAIVKSSTAEIYVISYQKFLEGTYNSHNLCKELLDIDNNTPKNEWRESLAQQMIGTRITTENHLEKAKSKFNPDFTDNVVTRTKTNEELVESIPEKDKKHVSSMRRFTLINDAASPDRRRSTILYDPSSPASKFKSLEGFLDSSSPLSSIGSLQALKKKQIGSGSIESPVSSHRKKSQSPDKLVEVPVVTPSILPLKGTKKKKFVNLIHPEATEVKVVFNERNKIAIDPSLVSVCLDLSPHSFQGSKVYQKRNITTIQDSVIAPKALDASPAKRNMTFISLKTDVSDISGEKSSPLLKGIQEHSPVNMIKKAKARPFEKKLGEILSMKNPKMKRAPQENFYHSMAINSMFVGDISKNDSVEIKKKEFYSPRLPATKKDVQDVHLPSIGNCYQPGMAMTRSFPHKKALGSHRNQ